MSRFWGDIHHQTRPELWLGLIHHDDFPTSAAESGYRQRPYPTVNRPVGQSSPE
jgi:hypothetical protein